MKTILNLLVIAMVILVSCKDSIVENEDKNVGRINFHEGTIDGVKTGDDTTAVIKLLGKPHWIGLGDFDGFDFNYEDKQKPGMEIIRVTFFNATLNQHPGDYRVTDISVLNSYSGKSKEGIGLGTTRSEVISKLGLPITIIGDAEVYRLRQNETKTNVINIYYETNKRIKQISLWSQTN